MRLPRLLVLGLIIGLVLFAAVPPSRAETISRHLALGNPSAALADPNIPNNYLIIRDQYALAYQRDDGIARWVSWELINSDLGDTPRYSGTFFTDTSLPNSWPTIRHTDYTNSGYDRGHIVSSEDRTASETDNRATFLITNVMPQAPRNNRGPWLRLEEDGRDLAQFGDQVMIIAGPEGEIGRLANGTLRIPAATWKVVLAIPAGAGNPIDRVTTATRLIAIRIPNDKDNQQVQQSDPWQTYVTTADSIETSTGLDLFDQVPTIIQRVLESRPDSGAQPYTLAISGTNTLTTSLGSNFPAITVRVTSQITGQPVAGVPLTAASLGISATALLGSDVISSTISDANGLAEFQLRANDQAGSYRLEVSTPGVFEPLIWRLTNQATERRVYLALISR